MLWILFLYHLKKKNRSNNNASFHLKARFLLTVVDLSPLSLALTFSSVHKTTYMLTNKLYSNAQLCANPICCLASNLNNLE